MHLIQKYVGVLCEALGCNQFLQQNSCSHVNQPCVLSSHLLQSNLKYKTCKCVCVNLITHTQHLPELVAFIAH